MGSARLAPPPSDRRPARWLACGALVALAVLAGVGRLYLSARSAQESQRPLAQLPPLVEHVHAAAFLPGRAGAALVGHHDGLLATDDGGRSWRALAAEGDVMAFAAHPARPDVVYAAGHDVLLKSDDGGLTWQPLRHDLPGTDVHALAVDPDDPSTLYAVVVGHGLYRGADGGTRWTRLADRMPGEVVGLAVTAGARRAFYLATADRGLLVSADGRDWASASGSLNGALPTLRLTALTSDPQSGDRYVASDGTEYRGALYVGTGEGLYKSVDRGGSWRRLPLQAGVAALAVDPGDSRTLLVVDGRGQVFRSDDRGVTWTGAGR